MRILPSLLVLGFSISAQASDGSAVVTPRNLSMRALADLSLDKLASLVVTDTKVAQSQDNVTQKIEVLDSEQLAWQGQNKRNLAEFLAYTSGQFVNVLSRNDANWGSYAGLGPKYNTWLLDGLPIDSFVDAMNLNPWVFERIEAQKGPASVLYSNYLSMDFAGNQTPLAGTSNFILRDRIEAAETRFQLGAGSYNTGNLQAYHQNRQGNLSYFMGLGYERSDYANYGTSNSWLNIIDRPQYDKTQVYAKFKYRFDRDDHSLSLFVHHTDHDGDAGRPSRDYRHRYNLLNLAYSNQVNDRLNLQAKFGYRHYDRRWGEDNFPANLAWREYDGVEQKILVGDVSLNFAHAGGDGLLTLGVDMQQADYTTTAETAAGNTVDNKMQARSTGFFVQEKMRLGDWVLRAGGRYNLTRHEYTITNGLLPEQSGSRWSSPLWSLGARYNHSPKLSFFGNVGSSFVAPSGKQIGGTLRASDAGVPGRNGQLPSPGLKPEYGTGADLGVDFRPSETLSLSLRGFYNKVDDVIIDMPVSVVPSQSQSSNAGSAVSKGIELGVRHTLSERWQWFGNLTLIRSRVNNPLNADADGTQIPFAQDRMLNLGLNATLPGGWKVSPYFRWAGHYYDSTSKSGRNRFGAYGTLNVKILKNLERNARYALDLAFDLNNVTNRRYEMPWGFRDTGFNGFAALQLTF